MKFSSTYDALVIFTPSPLPRRLESLKSAWAICETLSQKKRTIFLLSQMSLHSKLWFQWESILWKASACQAITSKVAVGMWKTEKMNHQDITTGLQSYVYQTGTMQEEINFVLQSKTESTLWIWTLTLILYSLMSLLVTQIRWLVFLSETGTF